MADLTHLFKVGQRVKYKNGDFNSVDKFIPCIVKETYPDHIIITDIETNTNLWCEEGFNMDCVFPDYNFTNIKADSIFEYSGEEFEQCYNQILKDIKKQGVPKKNHCVIFLGGQPGSGKSHFHSQDDGLDHYISIDGDRYRKYHPHYLKICESGIEKMPDLTQPFVNKCVERLIQDLSDEHYNIIIEGTLRDYKVTINTCLYLKGKGYNTDLYVMATNALTSWESCINRAKVLNELGEMPRTVPLEKYNYIVNNLVGNLEEIERAACFDKIRVIDRNNQILYPNCKALSASGALANILGVEEWNVKYNSLKSNQNEQQASAMMRKKKGR